MRTLKLTVGDDLAEKIELAAMHSGTDVNNLIRRGLAHVMMDGIIMAEIRTYFPEDEDVFIDTVYVAHTLELGEPRYFKANTNNTANQNGVVPRVLEIDLF